MNIIGYKYIYLTISGILVLASILLLVIWGLKPGIDFTGGTLMEIEFHADASAQKRMPATDEVKKELDFLRVGPVSVQPAGTNAMLIRFSTITEEKHQQILGAFTHLTGSNGFSEKRFDTIGPTIGTVLRTRALLAIALTVIAIILYLTWAFRHVSKPVASWKYGLVAVFTLVHDISIPAGVFAVLGKFGGVEVDSLFITALLTIMGFSVHDTIIIFDRIRENLSKQKSPEDYDKIVNRSLNETITRSINTSLTVLLVLAAIYVLGGETTRYFALALIVGIAFGTYSSIFVASPLLVMWEQFSRRREAAKKRR